MGLLQELLHNRQGAGKRRCTGKRFSNTQNLCHLLRKITAHFTQLNKSRHSFCTGRGKGLYLCARWLLTCNEIIAVQHQM